MNAHIRIRATWRLQWQWELITPDGHIASASHPFATREACEADAKQQGLPVKGLGRVRGPRVASPAATSKWRFTYTSSGLWQWRRCDSAGELIAESSRAFLTRDECVTDAVKHGYFGRNRKVPSAEQKRLAVDDMPSSR